MNAVTTTLNTNSIFDTKEEYVAFRTKWKQLHADGFHKPRKVEYECGNLIKNPETGRWDYDSIAHFMVSHLTVWHHLVFNLAIGRDPEKAFRSRKAEPNAWTRSQLWHALGYTHGTVHDFTPFGDTLTDEQKAKLTELVKAFRGKV